MSRSPTTRGAERRDPGSGGSTAPIEGYGLLADGRTVALVSERGSVDWWPVPSIDGLPIVAGLLDPEHGGRFTLSPVGAFESSRCYLPGTNVLETTYTTSSGICRVIECLTVGKSGQLPWSELARRVEGLTGRVELEWQLMPGDHFRRSRPVLFTHEGRPVIKLGDQMITVVVSSGLLAESNGSGVRGTCTAVPGHRHLVTSVATEHAPLTLPAPRDIDNRIDRTIASWERWTGSMRYHGSWPDQVLRSALTLKALLFEPGGAFSAAATTSLPERIGGDKNWDYRYSWVRDSSFAIDAFANLRLHEDVHSAVAWLLSCLRSSSPDVHVFYTLEGGIADGEEWLDVPGYRNSRPVRSGNRAARQTQLGISGDLFDAVYRFVDAGHLLDPGAARLLGELADRCCNTWQVRDSGIWELLDLQHYTISKIGCWTALDRAARLAALGQLPTASAERWQKEAEAVRTWVRRHCWSERQGSYTMYAGSENLDAAVLLAGRTGFDRGTRLRSTIEAIECRLGVLGGPLLYRYSGMEQEEGAFVACTFWMVDALVRTGQLERAGALMDRALTFTNDLGLFAEQIDPATGAFLGNYPQGLSHLALVNAAHAYDQATAGETRTTGRPCADRW